MSGSVSAFQSEPFSPLACENLHQHAPQLICRSCFTSVALQQLPGPCSSDRSSARVMQDENYLSMYGPKNLPQRCWPPDRLVDNEVRRMNGEEGKEVCQSNLDKAHRRADVSISKLSLTLRYSGGDQNTRAINQATCSRRVLARC